MMIIFVVLMANSSLVSAAAGQKSKTATLNFADIGMATIVGIEDQPPVLMFGCFDKKEPSGPGVADCMDIFGINPATGDIIAVGLATDSANYQSFYRVAFAGFFPPAQLLEEDQLEVGKHGTDIYVEVTVPLTLFNIADPTSPYVIPPFTMKFDSTGHPYKVPPEPYIFPSGWTFARITQRGYDATVTLNCPGWGVSGGIFTGTTTFNALDIFTPP